MKGLDAPAPGRGVRERSTWVINRRHHDFGVKQTLRLALSVCGRESKGCERQRIVSEREEERERGRGKGREGGREGGRDGGARERERERERR
jgi:hypothetical protein